MLQLENDAEEIIVETLLELREPFLEALRGKWEELPTCEEEIYYVEEAIHEFHHTEFWDNISGKPLDTKLMHEARRCELETTAKMGVW